MQCGTFSRILGLYSLDASSNPSSLFPSCANCGNITQLQTFLNIPGRRIQGKTTHSWKTLKQHNRFIALLLCLPLAYLNNSVVHTLQNSRVNERKSIGNLQLISYKCEEWRKLYIYKKICNYPFFVLIGFYYLFLQMWYTIIFVWVCM